MKFECAVAGVAERPNPGLGWAAERRAEFPAIAGDPEHAYLDSAATAQKPIAVIEAVRRHLEGGTGNVGRGSHRWGVRAGAEVERCLRAVRDLIGAGHATTGTVHLVSGATEAIRRAALDVVLPGLGAGDQVVVPYSDHRANADPWRELAGRASSAGRAVELVPMPYDSTGDYDLERLADLVGPRTRLVAATHVHHVFGAEMRIRELREAVGAEVPILLDAAQSVGHLPLDIQAVDVDLVAFSGHKAMAHTGVGVLWTRDRRLPAPVLPGLDGTPNVVGAVSLASACEWLLATGVDRIAAHTEALLNRLARGLVAIPGIELAGCPEPDQVGSLPRRTSLVAFRHRGIPSVDLGFALDAVGVSVRADALCQAGRSPSEGLVRASVHVYNTPSEVDRLLGGLDGVRAWAPGSQMVE
jgi:cysteine desulfurase/selenocysteine lyase